MPSNCEAAQHGGGNGNSNKAALLAGPRQYARDCPGYRSCSRAKRIRGNNNAYVHHSEADGAVPCRWQGHRGITRGATGHQDCWRAHAAPHAATAVYPCRPVCGGSGRIVWCNAVPARHLHAGPCRFAAAPEQGQRRLPCGAAQSHHLRQQPALSQPDMGQGLGSASAWLPDRHHRAHCWWGKISTAGPPGAATRWITCTRP